MALTKQDSSTNGNKLYILKIRSKDSNENDVPVFFQVSEKDAQTGRWTPTAEMKNVSGDLVSIGISNEEYKGEKYNVVKVMLEDNEAKESYILDVRFSLISRSLFNSMLSLKDYRDLKIGVYQTAAKEGKDSYAAISLRQGGEKVPWAFKLEDLPAITEIKAGQKTIKVYDDLNEFYVKHLKELQEKVKEWRKANSARPTVTETHTESTAEPVEDF